MHAWDESSGYGPPLDRARPLGQPAEQSVQGPAVDDAIGGNACEPGMGEGDLRVPELRRGVSVTVQREDAAGRERAASQRVVEILPRRVAIDLDGDATTRGGREHGIPVGDHARA